MISDELEKTLQKAQENAKSYKHQFMTLEHLLLAMTDDRDVVKILDALNIKINSLKEELEDFIKTKLKDLISEDLNNDVKPTLGFQRVIQRAVIHVQSSGKEEANGSNVLVAIFSERESHAVYYLQKQNLSRLDVVEYLSHGNNEGETEDFGYVKDQSDESENGIYIVSSSGPASRASDFDTSNQTASGTFVFVQMGTKNGSKAYICTSPSDNDDIGIF